MSESSFVPRSVVPASAAPRTADTFFPPTGFHPAMACRSAVFLATVFLATVFLATGFLATASSVAAQEARADDPAAAQGASAFAVDFLGDFDRASKKLVDLAEQMPAAEFDHRPTIHVRSVSEVLMHVAGTNFFLARTLGVEPPADLPRDLEAAVTEKDDALAWLGRSQDQLRRAVAAADAAGLDGEVELFGGLRSRRGVLLIALGHTHEHLGQMISLTRGLGMVPPWSRRAPG